MQELSTGNHNFTETLHLQAEISINNKFMMVLFFGLLLLLQLHLMLLFCITFVRKRIMELGWDCGRKHTEPAFQFTTFYRIFIPETN